MLSHSCHDCRNGPLFSHAFPDRHCARLLADNMTDRFKLSSCWDCPDWQSPIKQAVMH